MNEQIPYKDDVELLENPEPRCPVVLLLDVSGSMAGAPIDALNLGIQELARQLKADSLASKRVEISIVTFGESVSGGEAFETARSFSPPHLQSSGSTPMGEAVVKACSVLETRKAKYREAGLNYYRPWVFLITDGAPTDRETHYWQRAVELVKNGEETKKLLFFGVGVQGADMATLNQLCPSSRPAVSLQGLNFTELFRWLSSSLQRASSQDPGSGTLSLPPISGWATVTT